MYIDIFTDIIFGLYAWLGNINLHFNSYLWKGKEIYIYLYQQIIYIFRIKMQTN